MFNNCYIFINLFVLLFVLVQNYEDLEINKIIVTSTKRRF